MKLLVGLYHSQEGTILYNNIDSRDIVFDELRSQIGFVTQDTQLFAGTIRENLLFVYPEATEADLREACTKPAVIIYYPAPKKVLYDDWGGRFEIKWW